MTILSTLTFLILLFTLYAFLICILNATSTYFYSKATIEFLSGSSELAKNYKEKGNKFQKILLYLLLNIPKRLYK